MSFVETLLSRPDMVHLSPASDEDILNAEKTLGVSFATEYKEYLKRFGAVAVGPHEFTGLCSSERLNVVVVTQRERALFGSKADSLYVVEDLYIDYIIIWQATDGTVFRSMPDGVITEVAPSLYEYMRNN